MNLVLVKERQHRRNAPWRVLMAVPQPVSAAERAAARSYVYCQEQTETFPEACTGLEMPAQAGNLMQKVPYIYQPSKTSGLLSLTTGQILALAPDEASRKAGQGLAVAGKWVSAGGNARAVWGECQGSGSRPYQTVADTASLAFRCNCPSRKFPCKHGVGLLLYYTKDSSRFSTGEEPLWVSEWIDKREQKAVAAPDKEAKPRDEAAQSKRNAAREEKVIAGIDELRLWMKDALRTGIIQLPEKGGRYFKEPAARLVDAQAPGLARMLRGLADINYSGESWQTEVLDGFARLHLAATGFQHIDRLDAATAQDVRSAIGFPQGVELLEGRPVLQDTWLVAGSETEEEGSLTVERHWLLDDSGHAALFLQYVPFGQRPGVSLFPGQCFKGEVIYYPSASPLRVSIRNLTLSAAAANVPSLSGWEAVAAAESERIARWPLLRELPYPVAALRPVQGDKSTWLIEDDAGKQMRLQAGFQDIWKWMALCGGDYLPAVVLGAEHTYRPLGVWYNDTYVHLHLWKPGSN